MEPVARLVNRPGLTALRYRVGTHDVLKQRMLDRLRATVVPGALDSATQARPLAALTTRDADDPAIALIDVWAVVADVITFYQERIANEGFLRTATERQSVLELARAVGYELGPGISASAHLAFTVEDAPGAPQRATVPKGTKVQSIPGQGELPQTFETMEALDARAEWNELRLDVPVSAAPVEPSTVPQRISGASIELWLQGADLRLKAGDVLLVVIRDGASVLRRAVSLDRIDVDAARGLTRVAWGGRALSATEPVGREPPDDATAAIEVLALRQQAGVFGNVAPDWKKLPADQQRAFLDTPPPAAFPPDWPRFAIAGKTMDLDSTYPGTTADSWAMVSSNGRHQLFRITSAATVGRADFMLTGKVTRLELDVAIGSPGVEPRATMVLLQSDPLSPAASVPRTATPAAATPVPTTTRGTTALTLDRKVGRLASGRCVVVKGTPVDPSGIEVRNVATVTGTSEQNGRTTLHIHPGVAETCLSASIRIAANVVSATHGETVADEVLGSGDGRTGHQRFTLKRTPLAYLSAPTTAGVESTLEVRVNGVLWQEVPSFFGLVSRSHGYTVRRDSDGHAHVIVGDGTTGARLPSGQENVVATYRTGSGGAGNVGADALTLLQTRPLGIRGVTNSRAASGGVAPESARSARARAPRNVNTLGRVVSLADVEALAESLTGVSKAQAAFLWTGSARILHLTAADTEGKPVDSGSDLGATLRRALLALSNGLHRVQVDGHRPRTCVLEARLFIDPRARPERVIDAARVALARDFSFERRAFGEGLSASDVIATLHTAAGVEAVDLDVLRDSLDASGPALQSFVPAQAARVSGPAEGPRIDPAELLVIDMARVRLGTMFAREGTR